MSDNAAQTKKKSSIEADTSTSKPKRRPWIRFALVGVILVAVVLAAVFYLQENGTRSEAAEADPMNFAEVVITDLIQEETFNGVIGSIQDDPVKTMSGWHRLNQ